MISWQTLNAIEQLEDIKLLSESTYIILFKHSTRCSISSMALARLERSQAQTNATYFLLDLIQHRNISNAIAETFQVFHESPQVLVIKNGECIYDESHGSIMADELAEVCV
jgi:bacillithiol system protein YtxJ